QSQANWEPDRTADDIAHVDFIVPHPERVAVAEYECSGSAHPGQLVASGLSVPRQRGSGPWPQPKQKNSSWIPSGSRKSNIDPGPAFRIGERGTPAVSIRRPHASRSSRVAAAR